MGLKIKIGKADYESLDDSLKSFYVADGDDYKLDADYEDVSGLKAKNAELLAELKKRSDLVKQFEGLDAEEAKNALAQLSKIEEDKLLSKQKFDEVLAKRTKEFEEKLAASEKRSSQLFETQAERDLHLKLAAHLKADQIENAAIVLRHKYLKPVENNGKAEWKSLDDTETYDLDAFIPTLNTGNTASWFPAKLGPGSGASPSHTTPGGVDLSTLSPIEMLNQANSAKAQ